MLEAVAAAVVTILPLNNVVQIHLLITPVDLIKTAALAFAATKYVVEIQVILIIVAMRIKLVATVIVVPPGKCAAMTHTHVVIRSGL